MTSNTRLICSKMVEQPITHKDLHLVLPQRTVWKKTSCLRSMPLRISCPRRLSVLDTDHKMLSGLINVVYLSSTSMELPSLLCSTVLMINQPLFFATASESQLFLCLVCQHQIRDQSPQKFIYLSHDLRYFWFPKTPPMQPILRITGRTFLYTIFLSPLTR